LSSTWQANQHHAKPAGESAGQPLNRVFKRYTFRWKFTRDDLRDLLARIDQHEQQEAAIKLPSAA
jgi:hypothetical protein